MLGEGKNPLSLRKMDPIDIVIPVREGRRPSFYFSGHPRENYLHFRQAFLGYCKAQCYTEGEATAALVYCMRGKAAELTHNVDIDLNFSSLLLKHDIIFSPFSPILAFRDLFHRAYQKEDETIKGLHQRILRL